MRDLEKNVDEISGTYLFKLDKYLITFQTNLSHEIFENESYRGITFYTDTGHYEIIHGLLGTRLLVNKKPKGQDWNLGHEWCDIPFHNGTFHFLPKEIIAINYDSMSSVEFEDFKLYNK